MKAIPAFLVITVLFAACSTNNVTVDDSLGRFFDSAGVKGCFALFDNGQGHFTIYNLPRYRDSAFSPDGTFDLVQSLIALQTGVASDERRPAVGSNSMRADTANPQWVAPLMSLTQAFQASPDSANLGFADLARRIGTDTLKKWLDTLHYGNRDISGSRDSFWLQGTLKITADEQLGLIKKLYFGQLPFFKRPQEIVRGMLHVESNSNYKLYYKTTSQGNTADGKALGWAVGWIEENGHPYFFVVNLDKEGDIRSDTGLIGLEIAKKILRDMGFFGGTK
jgi:beta-lactamase class D